MISLHGKKKVLQILSHGKNRKARKYRVVEVILMAKFTAGPNKVQQLMKEDNEKWPCTACTVV